MNYRYGEGVVVPMSHSQRLAANQARIAVLNRQIRKDVVEMAMLTAVAVVMLIKAVLTAVRLVSIT